MKKLFAIIAILGSISLSSFAQSHSDRITFGMGFSMSVDSMLHLHGNTKPSTITLGNTSLMAISNGMSVKVVGMCVLNHSGRTTEHGVLV
jgi:hypothetical protein